MAATSQPLATAAAIRVLQHGGNAVDAAIAANAVLGVVEPMSCGIGGDLFAIVWDAKTKKLYGLNASGRSPAAATIELCSATKGLDGDPHARPAVLVGPRLRRRLGPASQTVRLPAACRAAGAGDRVRRGRLSRQRDHRRRLAGAPSRLCGDPDLGRLLPARRPRARRRGRLPQPRPGAVAPIDRRRMAATPSTAGRSPTAIVALLAIGRRPVLAGGFRRSHQQLGRSGLDQLPRLRRLGAAAQRPGDRRAPDAQPARAVTISRAWARSRPRRCT